MLTDVPSHDENEKNSAGKVEHLRRFEASTGGKQNAKMNFLWVSEGQHK